MVSKLSAGAAQVTITPPLGVWMTGFGGRPSGCIGVRDDLCARALVLDDGTVRVALVTVDVLTMDADLVERFRELVAAQTGIVRDRLLLNYSHTHGGPATATLRGLGSRDDGYCEVLVRQLAGCVKMANDRLQPARIGFATEPVQIGVNRRQRLVEEQRTILGQNPQGPVCQRLDLIKVTTTAGAPLACVFSHACHPVVMGGDNLEITADWPGFACRRLAGWLVGSLASSQQPSKPANEQTFVLFLQGCTGNINPRIRGTYEIAQQLGTIAATAALKAWHSCETRDDVSLAATLNVIDTPLQNPPSVSECEALVADWERQLEETKAKIDNRGQIILREGCLQWARSVLELSRTGVQECTLPYEIFSLRINGAAIVALAGEVFYELAQDIERHSPFANTVVLGYSNGLPGGHPGWEGRGAVGYLPDAGAYPDGGYEVEVAIRYYGNLMFAPTAAKRVCDGAIGALKSL